MLQIYWFALIGNNGFSTEDEDLLGIIADYPEPVKDTLLHTNRAEVICDEIWGLKPIRKWHIGNVCLLGGVCHVTYFNMGQGVCQAIERILALSICLKEEKSNEAAFTRYEKLRKGKAKEITKTSWLLGKIAQSDNSIVCVLREIILKLTPKYIAEKQGDKVFNLNY